jgi:hypothetical protein
VDRQKGSPLRQELVKGYEKLEEERLVPHVTSQTETFTQAQVRVSKMILSARSKTKDAKERAELLEMLRVTDPGAAYEIERKAADILPN